MNPAEPRTTPPGAELELPSEGGPVHQANAGPLPPKRARLLKLAEELAHRLIRRVQAYRRVRSEGPLYLEEWANERDVDRRIDSGDPIAVIDAMADAADGIADARRQMEIELGIDAGVAPRDED